MLSPFASLGEVEQPNGETKRRLSLIEKVMVVGVVLNGISLAAHLWEMRRRDALLRAELARRAEQE
jgi:hypothetical protein